MNLEQRVEALEQKLDAFFANQWPRVRNIAEDTKRQFEEKQLNERLRHHSPLQGYNGEYEEDPFDGGCPADTR